LGKDKFDFVKLGSGRKLQQEGGNPVRRQSWRARFAAPMISRVWPAAELALERADD
jgi:hypothetical protein